MTIDEFCKMKNFPKMKVLGEIKNFRYYIEKNPPDEDEGEPIVIIENIELNVFDPCSSDQTFAALDLFGE